MTKNANDEAQRTTPIGMARYAGEFHEAAIAADDILGKKSGYEIIAPIPVLYLIGHAMELSLKAFLLHQGVTLRELKTHFGHDIGKCLKKAKELKLLDLVEFDDHELSAFSVLNTLYSTKQLEYIVTGAKQFPVFGYLQTMSKKLNAAVGGVVGLRLRDATNSHDERTDNQPVTHTA